MIAHHKENVISQIIFFEMNAYVTARYSQVHRKGHAYKVAYLIILRAFPDLPAKLAECNGCDSPLQVALQCVPACFSPVFPTELITSTLRIS